MSFQFRPQLILLFPIVVFGACLGIAVCQEEGGTGQPEFERLNAAMGLPLWSGTSLWEEDVDEVAKRLGWNKESQTSFSSSFRKYPPAPLEILGAKSYALSLHGDSGKASAVSLIFSNKGDVERMIAKESDAPSHQIRREQRRVERDYKRFIREDARKIEETLTGILGPPVLDRTGETSKTREIVKRWDWEGNALLLASPSEEYVALRIVPKETADGTSVERVTKPEFLKQLADRVVTRPGGDVILSEMPMVDQGPKGYCVPATWERALRYTGIPADMNTLAMAGDTGVGGGTSTKSIAAGANDLVRRYGRRLVSERVTVNPRSVSTHIDKGLPIMWTMFVLPTLNEEISLRAKAREKVTDWEAWKKSLDSSRKEARKLRKNPEGAHVCMIIGYNKETGEVAVSDSWGPAFAERWITIEEAEAISGGEFTTIQP